MRLKILHYKYYTASRLISDVVSLNTRQTRYLNIVELLL